MIRKVVRTFAQQIDRRIVKEQQNVKQRFQAEKSQGKPVEELEENEDKGSPLGEFGYRVRGPEPTRFGDWERRGRVTDF